MNSSGENHSIDGVALEELRQCLLLDTLRNIRINWSSTLPQKHITAMQAEADRTLAELASLLAKPEALTIEKLLQFLSTRWARIKNTDLSYFQFPFHPINRRCEDIAKFIIRQPGQANGKHWLELLMPGLEITDYFVHGFDLRDKADKEIYCVHEFLTNDQNNALLPIRHVFNFATEGAKQGQRNFSHGYLGEGGRLPLTTSELDRLRQCCPEAQALYSGIEQQISELKQPGRFITQLKEFKEELYTCGKTVSKLIRALEQKQHQDDESYQKERAAVVETLVDHRGANASLLKELLDEAHAGQMENLGTDDCPSLKYVQVIQNFHQLWYELLPTQRATYGKINFIYNYKTHTLEIILLRLFLGVGLTLTDDEKKRAESIEVHPCIEENSIYINELIADNSNALGFIAPDYVSLLEKLQLGLKQQERGQSVGYGISGMQTLAQALWPLMNLAKNDLSGEVKEKAKNLLGCLFPATGFADEWSDWFIEEISKYPEKTISGLLNHCQTSGIIKQFDSRWLLSAAQNLQAGMVGALVNCGVDWRLKDGDEKTALDLAKTAAGGAADHVVVQKLQRLQDDFESVCQTKAPFSAEKQVLIGRWPWAQWQLRIENTPFSLLQTLVRESDIETLEFLLSQEQIPVVFSTRCYPKKVLEALSAAIKQTDSATVQRIFGFFKDHKLPLAEYWNGMRQTDAELIVAVGELAVFDPENLSVTPCDLIDDNTRSTCLLFNGDYASGSTDGTIGIWRQDKDKQYRCEQILTGHEDTVCVLVNLPNGDLASGSDDGTVRIWCKDEDGQYRCQQILTGHEGWVRALVNLPNGDLASGSGDGTVHIWHKGEDGQYQCQQTLTGHKDCVQALVNLPNGDLASGSGDGTLRIWCKDEDGQYRCEQILTGHEGWVRALVNLPNGDLASRSRTVRIWHKDEGGEYHCQLVLSGHKDWHPVLANLPNGHLASSKGIWALGPLYLQTLVEALQRQDTQAIAQHLAIPCVKTLLTGLFSRVREQCVTPFEAACKAMLPSVVTHHPDMATPLFNIAAAYPKLLGPITGSLLHFAAALNQSQWIETYLTLHTGALINLPRNALGQNPLHVAVKFGFTNMISRLSEACPQWREQEDNNGRKPIDTRDYAELLGKSMSGITGSANVEKLSVVMVGQVVGKSTLLTRFVDGVYVWHPITIGVDFKCKVFDIDKRNIKLYVSDTQALINSGLLSTYCRKTHAIILCCALDSAESFDFMKSRYEYSCKRFAENIPVVVAACRSDLVDEREVSYEDLSAWCSENNIYVWFECSAKDNINVYEVFASAAEAGLEHAARLDAIPDDDFVGNNNPSKCRIF